MFPKGRLVSHLELMTFYGSVMAWKMLWGNAQPTVWPPARPYPEAFQTDRMASACWKRVSVSTGSLCRLVNGESFASPSAAMAAACWSRCLRGESGFQPGFEPMSYRSEEDGRQR